MRCNLDGLAGWIKNSFIDFPRTVSTVLFFSGCNLRCPYCHNYSLITSPDDMSIRSKEIWEFLERRKKIIEGVVFTGGEPTLHPNIKEIIKEVHKIGYKAKLDTNGLLPDMIEEFSPDYLALDIKTDPKLYRQYLKAQYNNVASRLKKSLSIVKKMGENAEVRITVTPKIINRDIILGLRDLLEGVELVCLQPVNLSRKVLIPSFFKSLNPITREEIAEFQELLMPVVGKCVIRDG